MYTQIDRDTLNRKLAGADRPVLVEALPEKYFRDWRLPRARHLPHDEVERLAACVRAGRSAAIVVYGASRSCQNSHVAAGKLVRMGYENVAVYPGGKQEWSEAGLAIERGETLPA